MQRRDFLKLSAIASSALFYTPLSAKEMACDAVDFSQERYTQNGAQLIIVSLYGGASQLAANLTNIEEIKRYSQNSYEDYFGTITPTRNGCWKEGGGDYLEAMLDSGDLSIVRTLYSQHREDINNKAHGLCVSEVQKGCYDTDGAGIITNIAKVLEYNGVIDTNTLLPFVTFEEESTFYAQDATPLSGYLHAVGMDKDLNNFYYRYDRYWYNYTQEERDSRSDYNSRVTGFDPALSATMDQVAQHNNTNQKIKEAFEKRKQLSDFIETIAQTPTPDLGENQYLQHNIFAESMESAIKIMQNNSDTKIITLTTGGLGGWDDHDNARNYLARTQSLFKTLQSALAHLYAVGKEEDVTIMVFGEFGRNVNLNASLGWDHGNLQNLYILGGKRYIQHQGIIGETVVDNTGELNRLYLKPKEGTPAYEHIAIAATIYKLFGIENPEYLTQSNSIVSSVL